MTVSRMQDSVREENATTMFLPHGSESFIEGEEERCAAPDDVEIFNLLSLESDTKDNTQGDKG